MEEQRYQELRNKVSQYSLDNIGSNYFIDKNLKSNLNNEQNLKYISNQSLADDDWTKYFKAIYNGVSSAGRGVLGAMSAAVAENVAIHQRQDPNYKPYGNYANEIAEGLENAARSDVLTPYAVRGSNVADQFVLDLLQGGGQLAGQAAVTLATGGLGGGLFMGASIAGNQYLDLRDKGVGVERAAQAGLYNAIFQAPLEQVGVGKILSKLPAGTVLGEKLRQIRNAAISEGITEAMQKFPEALTNIYAENEGKTTDEMLEIFKKDLPNILAEAGYEGIIGGILGGAGSGANIAFNDKYNHEVKKAVLTNNLEQQQERIANIQKNGVNPKYAAITINNNMPNSFVYVDGDVLYQYANEKGIEKTAEALGITAEDIVNATNEGHAVEIKQGNFEAACASDMTLFQTVKNNIAYEAGGYSLVSLEQEANLRKEAMLTQEAREALDTSIADIRQQMDTALVPKAQADQWEVLLTSRAMAYNPENPAEWFKRHPLQITRNGIVSAGGYNQAAAMKKQTYKNIKEFDNVVQAEEGKISKLGYWVEVPSGREVVLSGSTYLHIQRGRHPLTLEQWQAILDNVDDFNSLESIVYFQGKTGSYGGSPVGIKMNTPIGKAGAVLEFLPKGKVFIVTAIFSNDGAIDNWIKNKKNSRTLEASDIKSQQRITSSSSLDIIQDNFTVVNTQTYTQDVKGQINFNEGQSIINFFEKADASTVIHETGHYFVEALAQDVANGIANEQAVKDWNTLLEYCEVTQEQWDKGGETRRKAHEKLAEGFETYLMEGKAPSPKLRKVFVKFSKWLKAVYRKIRRSENADKLTDEVREVFDRMLASDEMIAEQARINGIFAKLPKVITDSLSEKQNAFLMTMIEKARETATTLLVKDSLVNFSKERREEIAKYREANKKAVEEMLLNDPLYAASDSLEEYVGLKQKAKTIARKYQNAEGKIYADWQAELKAVRADIDERLNPIIAELENGMGQGVSIVLYDEQGGKGERLSNNAQWYSDWYARYGRKPNKAELKELAIGIYTGKNDVLGYWSSAGLSIEEQTEMEAMQEQLSVELEELLARETELQEQKESVKPFSHKGLNAEQRANFEAVAEGFGFASGADLAKLILEKPSYREAVNAYLDTMVQQKYPDIYKERKLAEQAAKEDLYNEDMGAVIGLELELVNEAMETASAKDKADVAEKNKIKFTEVDVDLKYQARRRTNEELGKLAKARNQQAKAAAQQALARLSVREAIRVDKYITAERKCAAKAAEAMAKKDYARAQGYKQQQLYNHACVRESMRIRKRFEQHRKYLNKQIKAKRDTWYREEFFNQAGALFERMGLRLKGYDPTMNKQSLKEFIDWANAEYDNADIADWIVNGTVDIRNPNNLTFSQYEDVVNALRNIKAVARAAKGENAFNSKVAFENWKAEALENLAKLKTKWKADINKTNEIGFVEKYLRMLNNADSFFEAMDNDQNGFFTKWIFETAKMAQDKEAEMIMRYEQRKREAYKEWLPTDEAKKQASEMRTYDELGSARLNKHNLISMLIYLTTKSSSDKLCSTATDSTYFLHFSNSPLWVEGDVEATRENLLVFLGGQLTSADIVYAQSRVDAANMFWSELEALEKKTKGFSPKKEEAYPAFLTLSDNQQVVFKGGYIPLVRDRQAGSRPKSQKAVRELDEERPGANIRTLHTNTGSTKARDASVYPLNLTEGFEDGAIMDTIHDICFRELMSDYRRMFNDAEMYKTLKEKLGESGIQSLEEYARSVAQPYSVGKPTSIAGMDLGKAFSFLRRKAVYFAIMGKFSTAFQNVGNILLFGNNIEGFTHKDSLIAMANWNKNVGDNGKGYNAMREYVVGKSIYMRERMDIPDISLRQMRDEKATPNIVEQKAVEFGTKMLVFTDNLTALPVWIHAYNKQIKAGMSEQEAINFADTVIRRTLGSSRKSDVAPLFRDDSLKLFTVFQSFFNTQFNQWAREARLDSKLIKNGEYTKAAKNIVAFAGAKFIAANMLSLMLTGVNPFGDDDDDGYMNITKSLVTYPLQMAGPIGTVANTILQNAIGMENYGYRLTPAQSAFDTVIKTSTKANRYFTGKGEFEDLAEASTNMLGMFYGVPQQVSIFFWNGYDIFVNDMDIQAGDIFRRRPIKER